MAKCVLCEGKIVGGRCVDCGMDYSRMSEHTYRLNTDCDTYDRQAKKINQEYEKSLLGKGEKDSGRTRKTVVNGKASARPNERSAASLARELQNKAASARSMQRTSSQARTGTATQRQQEIVQERKEWKKEAKKKPDFSIRKVAVAVVVLLLVLLEIFDDIGLFDAGFELLDEVLSDDAGVYEEEYDDGDLYEEGPPSTENLYDRVTEEMPEEGGSVDLYLTAGTYIVGESIPQGTYSVCVSGEGSGYLDVEDETNFIWYYTTLETYDSVEDLRLYPGARVSIEGGCEVNFYAENGQWDELVPYETPEDARSYRLTGEEEYTVTAGSSAPTRLEPGRYDLLYGGDEPGIVAVAVYDNDGNMDYVSLSNYENAEDYSIDYKNLELQEGYTLEVNVYGDDAWLELVPSTAMEY